MRFMLFLLLLWPSQSLAQWTWTPANTPHLKAVVRVSAGGSGGAGCYVQYGQLTGVLTAAHVIEGQGQATAHFSDGTSQRGWCTVDKARHDIGFIQVTHASIRPAQVSQTEGQGQIEIAGYGGPEDIMRHFSARVIGGDGQTIQSDGAVTHGDSGGPWFVGGLVCGVQSTGGEPFRQYTDSNGHSWPIYRTSRSARCTPIRSFLQRVHNRLLHHPSEPGGHQPVAPGGT